jgi:hypothetical protein
MTNCSPVWLQVWRENGDNRRAAEAAASIVSSPVRSADHADNVASIPAGRQPLFRPPLPFRTETTMLLLGPATSRPMMQDSERRIMPNVWLRISADTSRLSVQLKGPPTFFAQNYRRSARPGQCLDLCGPPPPPSQIFWVLDFWFPDFLLALYFVWYNFVKIHKAHKLTPGDGRRHHRQAVVG